MFPQGAFGTSRFSGDADFAAVLDELMAEVEPPVFGDEIHEIALDFFRVFVLGQAQTLTHTPDVRVDNDARNAESVAKDCVGGLAADPGQLNQGVKVCGNPTVKPLTKYAATGLNILRLVPVEARGLDVKLQLLQRGIRKGFRRWILFKKTRSHLVNTLICALGGKNGGHQELKRAPEIKRAPGIRVVSVKDVENCTGLILQGLAVRPGFRFLLTRHRALDSGLCVIHGLIVRSAQQITCEICQTSHWISSKNILYLSIHPVWIVAWRCIEHPSTGDRYFAAGAMGDNLSGSPGLNQTHLRPGLWDGGLSGDFRHGEKWFNDINVSRTKDGGSSGIPKEDCG